MNKIEDKKYFDYCDVLIKPKYSFLNSRKDVNLYREYKIRDVEFSRIPIIISNMTSSGTFEMAHATEDYGIMTCFHKHYTAQQILNEQFNKFHFISVGIQDQDITKLEIILDPLFNSERHFGICIDVANGYMKQLFDFIGRVRKRFPKHVIMAGNCCTPDIIQDYVIADVDIVKVGIGTSSICRTREVAAIGVPQLSALLDCVEEADKYKIMICGDGGINTYADFSKCLGTGSDFAMSGSMFGGHKESAGKIIYQNEKEYKQIYGMSSETSMENYHGGMNEYRASEGRTILIPYKGEVKNTVKNILGGIRSCMTYTNTKNIIDLPNNVTFIPVSETINRKHEKDTIGY